MQFQSTHYTPYIINFLSKSWITKKKKKVYFGIVDLIKSSKKWHVYFFISSKYIFKLFKIIYSVLSETQTHYLPVLFSLLNVDLSHFTMENHGINL